MGRRTRRQGVGDAVKKRRPKFFQEYFWLRYRFAVNRSQKSACLRGVEQGIEESRVRSVDLDRGELDRLIARQSYESREGVLFLERRGGAHGAFDCAE